MTNKLAAYAKELSPTIRKVLELKELLKEFKSSDDGALELQETIKEAQEELKDYLSKHEDSGATITEIKELEKDLKEGFAAAVKDSDYKPADFKAYLIARANDKVEVVVAKGVTFGSLEGEIA